VEKIPGDASVKKICKENPWILQKPHKSPPGKNPTSPPRKSTVEINGEKTSEKPEENRENFRKSGKVDFFVDFFR